MEQSQYIRIVKRIEGKRMKIEITMQEYFEELKLMEQQYGLEEDLYPWIYMLLKMAENRKKDILNEKYKDISIRDVHKWNRSTVSDKIKGNRKEIMEEILSKKGGPPDIALIDIETNSFLGCVEIKAFKAKNKYVSLMVPKCEMYKWEGCRYRYEYKYTFIDEVEKDNITSLENELENCKIISFEGKKYILINSNEENLQKNIQNKNIVFSFNKKLEKISYDEKVQDNQDKLDKGGKEQIIKHLVRFKKVLYTNGLEFYQLKLESNSEINYGDIELSIKVKELANLHPFYEEYKKNRECVNVLLKANAEWDRLIAGLMSINWFSKDSNN